MIARFSIPGRLAGLNDLIGQGNRHWAVGNRLKQEQTTLCAYYAKAGRVPVIGVAVKITLFWVEKDRRRDLDNIAAGVKFVLDGLVAARRLPNDTRRWVRAIEHRFPEPEAARPRVDVLIEAFA